ncbi:RGS domain-containing protein [Paraphoma chrysanthemicola]|nr:RGS domain-containing protein [Paraphoma chrysanthemicola]
MSGDSSRAQRAGNLRDRTPGNPHLRSIGNIIHNPALSQLFKEFLEKTHCWENFAFYVEVASFVLCYDQVKPTSLRLITSHNTETELYRLYHTFIAHDSPYEINLDQTIRSPLVALLTSTVNDRSGVIKSLDEIVDLLKQAQGAVFELLARDSLPKFLSQPEYEFIFRDYGLH